MITECFAEQFFDPFNGIEMTEANNLIAIQGSHAPLAAIIDRACWAFRKPCTTKSIYDIVDVNVDDLNWLEWIAWLKTNHDVEYNKKTHVFSVKKINDSLVTFSYKPTFSTPQILSKQLQDSKLPYIHQNIHTTTTNLVLKTKEGQKQAINSFLERNDCQPKQIEIKTDIIAIDFDHLHELGINPSQPLNFQPKNQSQYNNFLSKIKNLETAGQARIIAKPQLHMIEGESATIENKEFYQNHPLTLSLALHADTSGLNGIILNIHLYHQYLSPQNNIIQNELKTLVYAENHQLILLGGLKELVSQSHQICLVGMKYIPILKNIFCLNQSLSHNQLLLILLSPEIKQTCKLQNKMP